MAIVFEWDRSDFDKLVANCPGEPVTPFIFKYFPAGSHLLEAGCGSGRFVYWLAEKGYAIEGVEIGEKAVANLNQRFPLLKIRQGDVCRLPYADNSFDGILSLGVIEHVYAGMDDSIREMHRVLKPGGIALVIVPCFNLVRRLKYCTGIYHLHALAGCMKRWNFVRRLFGKPPHLPVDHGRPARLPGFKRWPMFGEFYEYRLTRAEFEHELVSRGFTLLESVPTSLIDGLYLEFGRLFVRFGHLEFHPNAAGRWLNDWLARRPYWHNHMQLCVVRKEAAIPEQ
jgi:SAM-dependent methyltransferase